MFALLASPIGGALYRLRGGVLKDWIKGFGTQASRAVWAVPTGALMWHVTGGPLWLLPVLVLSVFLSMVLVGTGQYLQDVPLKLPDWLGGLRTLIAAAPAEFYAPTFATVFALSGLIHAGLYWAAFRLKADSRLGEFIVGTWCWFIILLFWR